MPPAPPAIFANAARNASGSWVSAWAAHWRCSASCTGAVRCGEHLVRLSAGGGWRSGHDFGAGSGTLGARGWLLHHRGRRCDRRHARERTVRHPSSIATMPNTAFTIRAPQATEASGTIIATMPKRRGSAPSSFSTARCASARPQTLRGLAVSAGPRFCKSAKGRNRTVDTALFRRVLYQLSYLGPRVVSTHSISKSWIPFAFALRASSPGPDFLRSGGKGGQAHIRPRSRIVSTYDAPLVVALLFVFATAAARSSGDSGIVTSVYDAANDLALDGNGHGDRFDRQRDGRTASFDVAKMTIALHQLRMGEPAILRVVLALASVSPTRSKPSTNPIPMSTSLPQYWF